MKKKALIVVNLVGFLTFLWNDIKILQKLGFEVTIAGNGKMLDGSDAIEIKKLQDKKINFIQIEFNTKQPFSTINLRAYIKIKKVLKENNFELIHCHTPIVGALVRLAARNRNQSKVIYTTHGFAFTEKSSKKSWIVYYSLESICSKFCDAIITINNEDYENAKKMKCKQVYKIHGVGLDVKKFSNVKVDIEAYRKKIGVNKNDYMILSVGELSNRKNHQAIIRAIGMIKNNKIVYVICGREVVNSGIKNQLIELAKELNVRLILLGHRNDVPELYKCADISAIPSVREGLGMAGLEALASGVPLIGTNVQGIKEYLIDDITGYSSDAYNYSQYAENIKKLINMDLKKLEDIKTNCVKIAQKFDIENSERQMEKIYKYIIKGK